MINCKIVLDILEGRRVRFFNGQRPKSSGKGSSNNRKQQQQMQHHKQQQTAEAAAKATRTTGKTAHNKKSPASSSSKKAKTALKATKAVQTFWKVKSGKGVFLTQQQEQGGPNAGGPNPEKLRSRGVGSRRVVGGGGGKSVFPWKFGGIPAKFVSIG